jgi:polygalacturonase
MRHVRWLLAACAAFTLPACASSRSGGVADQHAIGDDGLPRWTHDVGARRTPASSREFRANDFGAVGDGNTSDTKPIQRAIDAAAAASGGTVTLAPGAYVTGALFLKSHVHLRVDSGVTLLGSQDDAEYPRRWTRVAGIEMTWPVALINVDSATDVKISGKGTIDGNGKKWWDRYWTLRRAYEPKGLRWASDYDAERVRLMLVSGSSDVTIQGLALRRSGFWTVQVLYSEYVTVDGISIRDNGGPSTDGVDIDSSRWILVQNTDIDNNDDDICLKSGRDADGLRVNRPTEYVVIRNTIARRGGGVVSFGSETAGGIRHVVAVHNRGIGTSEGIRFKSARTRGGVIEDVLVRDVQMDSVPLPFTFTSNWNPSYSYATLPAGTTNPPAHWVVLTTPVQPPERGWPEFRDITIEDAVARRARVVLSATGLPGTPLHDIRFARVRADGRESGFVEHARDWTMRDVELRTDKGEPLRLTDATNVEQPRVVPR